MGSTDPRSSERLRHHYEVERELAQRLLHSDRDERALLFPTLYDELFERVPDHPRLTRRETPEDSRRGVAARMAILAGRLTPESTLLEFAPGDCRLAYAACGHAAKVVGADISDQRSADDRTDAPPNFQLVVFDGFDLDLPDASVDVAFSYQFLEHLHPDDVAAHLALAHRVLRPGGAYIFDTPHAYSGPHDISRAFSRTPRGFHLKEWTYREMMRALRVAGFERSFTFRARRARESAAVNALTLAAERVTGMLPFRLRRALSQRLFLGVTMLAVK